MGCRWVLSSYLHKCYIAIHINIFNSSFSAEGDYECQILLCRISFAFRHNSSIPEITSEIYLKVIWLIYVHPNFVHAKTSLCVHYVHPRHCAHNFVKPWNTYWSTSKFKAATPLRKELWTTCNGRVPISKNNLLILVKTPAFINRFWNFRFTFGPSIPICSK